MSKLRRVLCAILSAVMLTTLAAAAEVRPSPAALGSVGTFRYSPLTETENETDQEDIFIYSDSFFTAPASQMNQHLATLSMEAALASFAGADTPETEQFRNIEAFLNTLGFTDVRHNDWYASQASTHSMGCAAGHKTITQDGKTFTLLAVFPRSGGYRREWSGNFRLGESGLHQGFREGRDEVLRFLKKYVQECGLKGETRLWIAGHSRGGAVANLTAGFLFDEGEAFLSLRLTEIYAYTFSSPNAVPVSGMTVGEADTVMSASGQGPTAMKQTYSPKNTDPLKPTSERYTIFNFLSANDVVTVVPFASWGFGRYGWDLVLENLSAFSQGRMLDFLEAAAPQACQVYREEGDPESFQVWTIRPSALLLYQQLDLRNSIFPSERQMTQRQYLQNRAELIASNLVSSREEYCETMEPGLTALAEAVFQMNREGRKHFFRKLIYREDGSLNRASVEALMNLLRYGAALPASQHVSPTIKADLKKKAEASVSYLADAFQASGAHEESVKALREPKNAAAVARFIALMLFGALDQENTGLLASAEAALTLAGNNDALVTSHYGVTMLAWMRSADNWYAVRES